MDDDQIIAHRIAAKSMRAIAGVGNAVEKGAFDNLTFEQLPGLIKTL
jgi:hypothetical protein